MDQSVASPCYIEAFKYLEVWGFSVIPVGKDKKPLLSSWKKYQNEKATEEELKEWWKRWPEANVGIVTGSISGITVVDIDLHKGASDKAFENYKTFTVRTGNGGLQLYYKYQEGLTISANAYSNLPHVDIRNDGGFVVAPPSVTNYIEKGEKRGGEYTVLEGGEFAVFPVKLFPQSKKKKKLTDLVSVSSGSRNSSMASIIGTLILPMDENKFLTDGWEAVIAVNKTYSPPLSVDELKTTFDSIVGKERQRRADSSLATPSPIQISPTERIDISLRKNSNHIPYKDIVNAVLALSQHPETAGKVRYNEFRQEIEFKGKPVDDSHLLDMVCILQNSGLPGISPDTVQNALQRYAFQNRYDEAVDWLKSLKWDGNTRLATWLINATGVEDDEHGYIKGVGAQWFKGLVSRIVHPGCVFDYVLVIVGPQGAGKTSLFRILGGEWYKSFTGAVENKDFYLQLRGAAILDLDEGVALYKSESIKIKSIITQTTDEYRAPYDRMMKKYPRRFVFSMSTNDTEPFRDVTGNRRYWPVEIKQVDFKWLEENREQLYAEAYHALVNKTPLPEVPMAHAADIQENFLPNDEWEQPIMDYIRKSYDYCVGSINYEITINEIFKSVLGVDQLEKLDKKHMMRIGTILKQNGFERRRTREGNQRIYKYYLTKEAIELLKKSPLVQSKEEFDKKQIELKDKLKKEHDDF